MSGERPASSERPPRQIKASGSIDRLLEIMAALRSEEDGCPWDREQTLDSLKQYLIEESYEVLDAIDSGDPAKHKEELGDLLLQVVFQSRIRKEQGQFEFADVARALCEKLIRRHPHVFGDVNVSGSQEVLRNWQAIKATEKGDAAHSVISAIPRHLPSLQKAHQVQSRAARVGFDWPAVSEVLAKVKEEIGEVEAAIARGTPAERRGEIGDLLFSVVNLARFLDINAEDALSATVDKFTRRFQEIERRVRAQGRSLTDCTLAEMDQIWQDIKKEEGVPS